MTRIHHSKLWLISEVAVLFFAVPLLLFYVVPLKFLLPTIWVAALLCHLGYRRMTGHSAEQWWLRKAVNWANWKPILVRFAVSAVLLTGAVVLLAPELLFNFVRANPAFWLLVMFFYPILSVVPQEIIFRSYFFTRYQPLFKNPTLLAVMSGVAFGFAHILFHNWVAPILCIIGGIMFARTYAKHRSLMLVALEHALYGDFVFTIGIGRYFYHGAVQLAH